MIVDFSGVAGTAGTDWDLLTATDAITVNASGQFTVKLAGDIPGRGRSQILGSPSCTWHFADCKSAIPGKAPTFTVRKFGCDENPKSEIPWEARAETEKKPRSDERGEVDR